MKKLLLLSILFTSLFANATLRTVSNSPATLAQFNNIQGAIDASASGDSVYVHGSPNIYAIFTITNKQLVIIGSGWAPNKNLPFTALVAGCNIIGIASSNTEIQGITFTNTVTVNENHPNNLRFIRNHFQSGGIFINQNAVTYVGYLFEGNLFENINLTAAAASTYQNFLLQNNYFYESGCCVSANVSGFTNAVNVLFNHNIWFGPASASRDCFASNCRFLTITNNIFIRRHAANQNSLSTFNNNITFNAVNNTPWLSNNNVDAGSNIANTDPQMTDQTAVSAGVNNALLDFTIAAGPANNAGSDGKDIGLLFDATGSLNWLNSRASRLPYIFSMNITNPTITPGGILNVVVEARRNN